MGAGKSENITIQDKRKKKPTTKWFILDATRNRELLKYIIANVLDS